LETEIARHFKVDCLEAMKLWGYLEAELDAGYDDFYKIVGNFIFSGENFKADDLEDFLLDEGVTAYMRGYVSNEESVFSSDADSWLKIFSLSAKFRIENYALRFPNSWETLVTKRGFDHAKAKQTLQKRRSQLQTKQKEVIDKIQVNLVL